MFSSLTLKGRLGFIIAVAFAGFVVLTVMNALAMKRSAFDMHRQHVQMVLDVAMDHLTHLQDEVSSGRMDNAQARTEARRYLASVRYGADDYIYVIDREGNMVMHPFKPKLDGTSVIAMKDPNGKELFREMVEVVKSDGQGFVDYMWPKPGQDAPVPKISYVQEFKPWGWILGTGVYVGDVEDAFYRDLAQDLLVAAFLVMLIVGVAVGIARSIFSQIGGEPGRALEVMSRAAGGDFTVDVPERERAGVLGALHGMLQELRRMMQGIGQGAEQVNRELAVIVEGSSRVADASRIQTDATSSMAAAVEEMTASIMHISDSARETEENSRNAVDQAHSGGVQVSDASQEMRNISGTVQQAAEKMQSLEVRINEISTIASVIKDIAGQTNLLALNAAIEAARAGEQGRGFAVVADEVRHLASRTASATIQIEEMINAIQSETHGAVMAMGHARPQVDRGVALAESAASSLEHISLGAESTLHKVRGVADATREQTEAANNISAMVEQIAQMVETTSMAMDDTARSVESLKGLSGQLSGLVGRFKY